MAIWLGPIPPRGTGTLPGIVLCVLGVIGIIALPREIKNLRSKKSGSARIALLVLADAAFLAAGLLMFSGRI
jgi:hypothetical protein